VSDAFRESAEWLMGDSQQKAWARLMAGRNNVVLPTYGIEEVDDRTKAPVLFVSDGKILVAPDILLLKEGNGMWHEVKAKSSPSWRRFHPGPRWEHGIDYCHYRDYLEVERKSGSPVWIVIHEAKSPLDTERESKIGGPPLWLVIALSEISKTGEHRPKWSCGSRGMGGWLWPRSAMYKFQKKSGE
jgi:hypothetical protein